MSGQFSQCQGHRAWGGGHGNRSQKYEAEETSNINVSQCFCILCVFVYMILWLNAIVAVSCESGSACNAYVRPVPVMWSETVGLRTRLVWDQKIGLGLGFAELVLFSETRSCHVRGHNDLEGHNNFSSTIHSFCILCLEHHCCGDQQWRSLT